MRPGGAHRHWTMVPCSSSRAADAPTLPQGRRQGSQGTLDLHVPEIAASPGEVHTRVGQQEAGVPLVGRHQRPGSKQLGAVHDGGRCLSRYGVRCQEGAHDEISSGTFTARGN